MGGTEKILGVAERIQKDKNIVIVTIKVGSEKRIAQDLEDAVFPHDPGAKVLDLGLKGLLILETSLCPFELANLLVNRYPIRGIASYRPLIYWTAFRDGEEDLVKLLGKHIKKTGCKRIEVHVRFSNLSQDRLWRLISSLHENRDKDCIVSIEIINDLAGVALIIKP